MNVRSPLLFDKVLKFIKVNENLLASITDVNKDKGNWWKEEKKQFFITLLRVLKVYMVDNHDLPNIL